MQLERYYERITARGVGIYTVSVDSSEVSRRLRDRLGVRITFLADTEGELLDALGIRHRDAPGHGDIAYPASMLVDEDGVVRWQFRSPGFRERAHPDDVFAAIEALDGWANGGGRSARAGGRPLRAHHNPRDGR